MSKCIIVTLICAVIATAAPSVTELKSPAPPDSAQPNMSVGADGRVYLSWLEPRTPKGFAMKFSVRGLQGWSAPKTVATGTNWFVSDADVPSVVAMPDGTLAAHWFVASVGPRSEAYDINLVFSKEAGATWRKAIVPHREGTKRPQAHLFLAPKSDRGLAE